MNGAPDVWGDVGMYGPPAQIYKKTKVGEVTDRGNSN
jgi:hypothetical protein